MLIVIRILITTCVILMMAHVIPGLEVPSFFDALIFGLVLGVINAIIRPILVFLTLPISLVTLGLFLLVINGFTFWLAAEISYGIKLQSFDAALLGGIIIWITGMVTNRFIWKKGSL
jgi:putative membrane protein